MQKNMPRKKRRKLEAAREMLEDEDEEDKPKVSTPYLLTFSIMVKVARYNPYSSLSVTLEMKCINCRVRGQIRMKRVE